MMMMMMMRVFGLLLICCIHINVSKNNAKLMNLNLNFFPRDLTSNGDKMFVIARKQPAWEKEVEMLLLG